MISCSPNRQSSGFIPSLLVPPAYQAYYFDLMISRILEPERPNVRTPERTAHQGPSVRS